MREGLLWSWMVKKFILSFLGFALIPLVILGSVSYYVSANILKNELNSSTSRTMDKLAANIDLNIQGLTGTANLLSSNMYIQSYIQMNTSAGEGKESMEYINTTLLHTMASSKIPINMYIIDSSNILYMNRNYYTPQKSKELSEKIQDSQWFKDLFKFDTKTFWIGLLRNYDDLSGGEHVLYIGKNIVDKDVYLGTLIIGIPDYFISKQLNNLKISDESVVFLVDDSGSIVFKSEDSSAGNRNVDTIVRKGNFERRTGSFLTVLNKKRHMVNYQALTNFGWRIVAITPEASIYQKLFFIRNITGFLMLVSHLFIIISLLIVKSNMVSPIINLSRLMKRVRKGEMDARSEIDRSDEIGVLSDGFNSMLDEINKLISTIKIDEQTKRDLEFKVLQAQIKPHFLYNTLNSIKWMAEIKGDKNIAKAVTTLVKMLEYNMNDRSIYVKLGQEIEYLKWYIHLSNIRYGNCIESNFEIEAGLEDIYILKLILQPVVENSVNHGLIGRSGKGIINISVKKQGDDVAITITDNGKGIDNATLHSLLEHLASGQKPSKPGGMGLKNVNDRIKMEFGPEYGLIISSNPGEGTEVWIMLPAVTNYNYIKDDEYEAVNS